MRFIKTFYKEIKPGQVISARAYTDDGITWKWAHDNTIIPEAVAKSYGIPVAKAA